MARINYLNQDEDELPEISDILGFPKTVKTKTAPEPNKKASGSEAASQDADDRGSVTFSPNLDSKPQRDNPNTYLDYKRNNKERPFRSVKLDGVNTRLLPEFNDSLRNLKDNSRSKSVPARNHTTVRSSPTRKAKALVDYSKFAARFSGTSASTSGEDDDSFTDLSGFIVPDSASDEEVLSSRSQRKGNVRRPPNERTVRPGATTVSGPKALTFESYDIISRKIATTRACPDTPPRQASSPRTSGCVARCEEFFDLEEPFAKLRFSPPRTRTPHKIKDNPRPITPPLKPAKTISQSPSKKHRIPPSPHRPSIDAFWSQDVISDWNEQYSPRKPLGSPHKMRSLKVDEDEDGLTPSESPRKSPFKSPTKKDKKVVDQRKIFDASKNDLAISFLAEVDHTIAQGQVAAMAESSGGIKIIWSKKLSSTAGRANWRREMVRSRSNDGTVPTHRHHASIELAEKVIDDEDRLINVLAHEYCHLANFMISGIIDSPHGKEFKEWARKTTKAFSHRNVNVTTKHAYEIAYKYIWACISPACGLEYKRHSKSIDPVRQSCGSCKSKLVQIQPIPRKGQGERSEYQDFVKSEQARVRLENPGAGFGEIMAVLGREFRENKKAAAVKDAAVNLDSDDGLDSVARKLDFLTLV